MFFIKDFILYFFIFIFYFIHIYVLIITVIFLIIIFMLESFTIWYCKSKDVYIGSINWFYSSFCMIYSLTLSSIYTYNINSISWLNIINLIFISTNMKSLWSLSIRNRIRGLLHFNMLFITKSTKIVNHFKSESTIALTTISRF